MCGIGVMSFIDTTLNPFAFRDRIAESRPDPTPFTKTFISLSPVSRTFSAADLTITLAAYGVDFFGPLNPQFPALAQARVFPFKSVKVIIVLLYVA